MAHPTAPARFADTVIAVSLHCRSCGYDLRGLSPEGRCPECGIEIWQSLLHTVDPETSRLPRLRDPIGVGNALLWLTICMLIIALIMAARPVALWIDSLDQTGLRNLSARTPVRLDYVAAMFALGGLWSVWLFRPHGAGPIQPVRRHTANIGIGLLVFSMTLGIRTAWLGSLDSPWQHWLIDALLAGSGVAVLHGLKGVLGVIGMRSREWRTARGGRQRVRELIVAVGLVIAAQALDLLFRSRRAELPSDIAAMVQRICYLMIVIGLAYLVINGWWIRRALRSPAPSLDGILRREIDAAPEDPGD